MKALFAMVAMAMLAACAPTRVMMLNSDGDRTAIRDDGSVNRMFLAGVRETLDSSDLRMVEDDSDLAGGRSRRDADLVERVRWGKQAEALAIYAFQATIEPGERTSRYSVRVSGRLLDAASGRRLTQFDMERHGSASDCSRDCVLEHAGRDARTLGQSVAERLRASLVRRDGDGGTSPDRGRRGWRDDDDGPGWRDDRRDDRRGDTTRDRNDDDDGAGRRRDDFRDGGKWRDDGINRW